MAGVDAAGFYQSAVGEDAQVARKGRAADGKVSGDLVNGQRCTAESAKDFAAYRIAEGVKSVWFYLQLLCY